MVCNYFEHFVTLHFLIRLRLACVCASMCFDSTVRRSFAISSTENEHVVTLPSDFFKRCQLCRKFSKEKNSHDVSTWYWRFHANNFYHFVFNFYFVSVFLFLFLLWFVFVLFWPPFRFPLDLMTSTTMSFTKYTTIHHFQFCVIFNIMWLRIELKKIISFSIANRNAFFSILAHGYTYHTHIHKPLRKTCCTDKNVLRINDDWFRFN